MARIKDLDEILEVEKTPLEDRNLPKSTYDAIKLSAQNNPNVNAITFFLQATDFKNSTKVNYREFLGKINQTANLFHSLGVGADDCVSFIMPNLPETYYTLFGGEAAGISGPINPLLEPHVLAEIMNASKTKVLVTIAPFPKTDLWAKVHAIADDVPTLETILQVDIADHLSFFKKLVVNFMRRGENVQNIKAKVLNFNTELAKQPSDRLVSGRDIQGSDIASYFHTGGTTGTPKLAMHTHANEVFDGWSAGYGLNAQPGDSTLLGLPLFHNYGAIAIGVNSFINSASIVVGTPSGFRGDGFMENMWKIIEHYNIDFFGAVPTLFTTLLNHPVDADVSSVQFVTSGAAPLSVELAKQFEAHTGFRILEGYGLTEGTSANSVNPPNGESRIGSIGIRMPYQHIRIAHMEGAEFKGFANPEESGIVVMSGPQVFPGYKEDFQNEGVFFEAEGAKWLNTGDMGRLDEDGYIWLTGRKKELIIRGGHNIDPKQIEEPLHEHPAVALCASIGRPDARVGEMPVAYVQLKEGMSATEEELLEFAAANIGERAAVPKHIYIIPEIPLTAVGKIFKPTLTFQQVNEVFENTVKGLDGVASVKCAAEGDKRLGTVAHVTVNCEAGADKAAVEKAVNEALGTFTIHKIVNVS